MKLKNAGGDFNFEKEIGKLFVTDEMNPISGKNVYVGRCSFVGNLLLKERNPLRSRRP